MRRIPRWLVVLLVIAAATVLLKLTVFRAKPVPVQAAKVQRGEVVESVTNTRAGTLKVRQRSKLSPQIGGRVVAIPYAKGASVKAGSVLLKLDASVQSAQVQLAREELKTAGAKALEACLAEGLARKDWERGAALEKDGITSRQSLDTLESVRDTTAASCQAARAALEQARAQVKLAEAELALTEVTAPFDGVLADCSTAVGEWITPAPPGVPIPPVLDFFDLATAYVSAPIDEVDSVRVKPGQAVVITMDSRPGERFAGKLSRVAPYVLDVMEQNRTVEVEATFDDPARAASALPGTSSDMEIVLSRVDNVMRIPTAAVAEGGVVLAVEGGRLKERSIKTGLKNWQYTQVLDGLREGDWVVTARDSTAVKPGSRVTVQTR
jgi:HlyD family secretion protein